MINPMREGSVQRDDKIVPFNILPENSKNDNFVNNPISLGIVEVNELLS